MANEGITPEQQRLSELLNLEAAFRSSGQEVPSKLHTDISSLSGATVAEQLGSTENGDKQRQRYDAQVAAIVSLGISREIAANHVNFVENGFNEDKDFFTFSDMLDDSKYWGYLENNPEERKKVAECFCDGLVESAVKAGNKTAEQIEAHVEEKKDQIIKRSPDPDRKRQQLEQLGEEGDLHGKIRAASAEKSSGRSSAVNDIISPVESLVGKEKMDDLEVKSQRVAEIDSSSVSEITQDEDISTENRREAAKEIRTEVYAKAEASGVNTKRQKFEESEADDLAALFDEPENKVAANTLKKTQDDTKSEPVSKPNEVQLAENSKAAEKAATETGLA